MPSARLPNMIATTTPKRSHSRPIATPPKAKPVVASLHKRQSNRHRPHADAADGADRDRKSKPPHAAGELTSLSWRSRKSIELPGDEFNVDTSHGPPLSSTLRGSGYSSPIVTSVNDFTMF